MLDGTSHCMVPLLLSVQLEVKNSGIVVLHWVLRLLDSARTNAALNILSKDGLEPSMRGSSTLVV